MDGVVLVFGPTAPADLVGAMRDAAVRAGASVDATGEPSRIVASVEGAHVFITEEPAVAADYEPEEFAVVAELAKADDLRFVLIEYRDPELLTSIVSSVAQAIPTAVIDNDFGARWKGAMFARRLASSPDWEWWSDSQ